jgi:16S rRNA processing protein RimM
MSAERPPDITPDAASGLVVGAIVGTHGVRGELKLRPLTEFPERIPKLKELRLRLPDGQEERRKVLASRMNKDLILVRLEGIDTMNAAEELRGAVVVIDPDQAAPLPEGRFYQHQLLGLRVLTPDGEELGTIERIIEGASNDVYVAGNLLIPATHDAVLRLAPQEGVLVVRSKEYLEGEEIR